MMGVFFIVTVLCFLIGVAVVVSSMTEASVALRIGLILILWGIVFVFAGMTYGVSKDYEDARARAMTQEVYR